MLWATARGILAAPLERLELGPAGAYCDLVSKRIPAPLRVPSARVRAGLLATVGLATAIVAPVLAAGNDHSAMAATVIRAGGPVLGGLGSFTPSAPDPVLARLLRSLPQDGRLARSTLRFTPTPGQAVPGPVTVATHVRPVDLRANLNRLASPAGRPSLADSTDSTALAIKPSSYKLGESIGWKSFAQTGTVAAVDRAITRKPVASAPTRGVERPSRFGSDLKVETAPSLNDVARGSDADPSLELEVGGRYRLSRSVDVKAGVRYRVNRDRLDPDVQGGADSSAVYVGTAFRF